MDDALGAGDGAADGVIIRNGPGEVPGAVDTRGPALECCDGVSLPHQQAGDFPSEQAARAGDEDPHGVPGRPPASTVEAHLDRRVRSILALWRMSVG